jgi:low affinity Fe/Cu permease
MKKLHIHLEQFSQAATNFAGSSWSFVLAMSMIILWAIAGPFVKYSETWQLVINTSTTIITFLMVFLIQRSQNKESLAVHLKLNELVAAQKGASNRLINIEDLKEEDIRRLHKQYTDLAEHFQQEADRYQQHSIEEESPGR